MRTGPNRRRPLNSLKRSNTGPGKMTLLTSVRMRQTFIITTKLRYGANSPILGQNHRNGIERREIRFRIKIKLAAAVDAGLN